MLGLINPWLLLGALLAILASFGFGYQRGSAKAEAEAEHQALLIAKASEAAQQAAAQEIAKIDIRHTTIRQKVQRETIEKPVYRDCSHSPDGLRLVNQALSGRVDGADDLKLSRDLGSAAR